MKPTLTAVFIWGVMLVPCLAGVLSQPAVPIPRPNAAPHVTTRTLLEKTIFKVDVLTLELWLGPETVQRLGLPLPDDDESREEAGRIALDSRDAWAELIFKRDVSLDQFLGGIDENMRRVRDEGLITAEGYERVAAGLPRSYAPLAASGIAAGDRIFYRISGDTLRTVYQRAGGELVVDQTDIGPERRLSLLGSFFVKGSDFRRGLVGSLPHSRAD
jgi:hypothetical protein